MSVPIYVTAYCGYKGNERPHSFLVEEQLYEVEAILTRWYEPLFACFKLVTTDGKLFVIRYEQTSDQWTVGSEFAGTDLMGKPGIK